MTEPVTPTRSPLRPWRVALLLVAALVIAAQVTALVWVAQGQVERGRALQGGASVSRLISSDRCLDYRIDTPRHAGDRCGAKAGGPIASAD